MISKFRIRTADIMIRIALHVVVVCTIQLHHNSILCYYTVTEMHIIMLTEVNLSRLASRYVYSI